MSRAYFKCSVFFLIVLTTMDPSVSELADDLQRIHPERFSKVRHLVSDPGAVSNPNRALFDWTTNASRAGAPSALTTRLPSTDPRVRLEHMRQSVKDRRTSPKRHGESKRRDRNKKERTRTRTGDKKRKRNRDRSGTGIDTIPRGYFDERPAGSNVSKAVLFDWRTDKERTSKYYKKVDGRVTEDTRNDVLRYEKITRRPSTEKPVDVRINDVLDRKPSRKPSDPGNHLGNRIGSNEETGPAARSSLQNRLPPLSSIYPPSNDLQPTRNADVSTSDPIIRQLDFLETQLKQMENEPLVPERGRGAVGNTSSCTANRGGCEHTCIQNGTAVRCLCYKGFRLAGDGARCLDVDECAEDAGACSHGCRNVPGSFHCACPTGYRLSSYDRRTCLDINECLLRNGHGPCEDACVNTRGSFECRCRGQGARLAADGRSCVRDDGACSKCSHTCVYVSARGVAFCTCPNGMYLGQDYKTCEDINECEIREIRSICMHGCVNTIGSFHCQPETQQMLAARPQRVDAPDHVVCPPLFPPQHGYLDCRRDNVTSHGRRTMQGRYRFRNRPGTTCTLVCPGEQYRQEGRVVKVCGSDGRWISSDDGRCIPHPRPRIRCPSKIHKRIPHGNRRLVRDGAEGRPAKVLVPLPTPSLSPQLDFDRDVVSQPADAKRRVVALEPGTHWIKYTVTHPESKRSASCTTIVHVGGSRSR